ncbi:MAG TPA: glutamate racemase [Armatimonadota bacterium]|nr:glutamate racemase [Armatimonadota bacterium]
MKDRPIGVFDSGIGGLTVVRELFRQLPNESVLYLGDTARVPYGPRGIETIRGFALELAEFLLQRDVKALVIACNTISATVADDIRRISPVPVFDVVNPTVEAAVDATRARVLGVIGTVTTVRSKVYDTLARGMQPDMQVFGQECPLFVPIAEEHLERHPVARLMAEEYLAGFRGTGLDVLILGCTHYPLLREVVAEVMGPDVRLIDSAQPTVAGLGQVLKEQGLLHTGPPAHQFFVTDASYKFMQIANGILEQDVSSLVREVTLGCRQ